MLCEKCGKAAGDVIGGKCAGCRVPLNTDLLFKPFLSGPELAGAVPAPLYARESLWTADGRLIDKPGQGEAALKLMSLRHRYVVALRRFLGRNPDGDKLSARLGGYSGDGWIDWDDMASCIALHLAWGHTRLSAMKAARAELRRLGSASQSVPESVDLDSFAVAEPAESANSELIDRLRACPSAILNEVLPADDGNGMSWRGDTRARVVGALVAYLSGTQPDLRKAMRAVGLANSAQGLVVRAMQVLHAQASLPIMREKVRAICAGASAQIANVASGGYAARRVARWGVLSLYLVGDRWRVGIPRPAVGHSVLVSGVPDRQLPIVAPPAPCVPMVSPTWVRGASGADYCQVVRTAGLGWARSVAVPVSHPVRVALDPRRTRPAVTKVDTSALVYDSPSDRAWDAAIAYGRLATAGSYARESWALQSARASE